MAEKPIIFALANPDPEIGYDEAKAARPDAIVATGRSDYNNQVNNVLGFPFIFRGALDVRATSVSEAMKVAAAHALAELARRDVPRIVQLAYGAEYSFGPDYIIPKPFDPRVLHCVAPAVAQAAVASGVAPGPFDMEAYRERLRARLDDGHSVLRKFMSRAARNPKRIVFPEGDDPRILQACRRLVDEGLALPIVLGPPDTIHRVAAEHEIDIDWDAVTIVDPFFDEQRDTYVRRFYEKRQRKGMTEAEAHVRLRDRNYFGMMMVAEGRADGIVSGMGFHYSDTIRPALAAIGLALGARRASGMYLVLHRHRGLLFFGDTTVNLDCTSEVLADIGEQMADAARTFDVEPRVAMLSMSSFGSVKHRDAKKVQDAVQLLRARRPELVVDGEMQANVAVDPALRQRNFPFSRLDGAANVLVFPNLDAGNAAYKLLRELGGIATVGPVLLGMARPVTVLERDTDVDTVVLMTALTVVQAQERDRGLKAAE